MTSGMRCWISQVRLVPSILLFVLGHSFLFEQDGGNPMNPQRFSISIRWCRSSCSPFLLVGFLPFVVLVRSRFPIAAFHFLGLLVIDSHILHWCLGWAVFHQSAVPHGLFVPGGCIQSPPFVLHWVLGRCILIVSPALLMLSLLIFLFILKLFLDDCSDGSNVKPEPTAYDHLLDFTWIFHVS